MEIHTHGFLLLGVWVSRILRGILCLSMSGSRHLAIDLRHWPQTWRRANFLRSFDKVIEQAGLPPIRFHDARHTFATLMLELGESPKTVQTMLGHSRVAITLDIYSHVSLELEKKQPRS